MSTPIEPTPRSSSAAGRYFFMFLLGLVLGAVAVVMLYRTLESRQTPMDKWHASVMNVVAVHNGQLKKNIELNRCTANDTIPHIQAMRRIGDDIEPAFVDVAGDERFAKHAANFRAALDSAQSNPPLSCESLKQTVGEIGGQCKACHDDFNK